MWHKLKHFKHWVYNTQSYNLIFKYNWQGWLWGLTHGQKFIIWMTIPVKNNSNDKFLARVQAN